MHSRPRGLAVQQAASGLVREAYLSHGSRIGLGGGVAACAPGSAVDGDPPGPDGRGHPGPRREGARSSDTTRGPGAPSPGRHPSTGPAKACDRAVATPPDPRGHGRDRHLRPRRRRHGRDRQRGALRDRVLRIGVHRDRPGQPLRHQLRHQRDPRRPADQQHRGELTRPTPRRADGGAQRVDRLLHLRADHRLELAAVQPHRPAARGQEHRDRHVGVGRERLLGLGALPAHPRDGGQHGGVGVVEVGERDRQPRPDVLEHDLVEVDAAEPVEPLRPPEQPEPRGPERGLGPVGLAHDGRVERAAAQVVHGDGGPGRDPLLRGVVQRRGLRLGEQGNAEALRGERGGEQVLLVAAPRRRVGERDLRRLAAFAFGHPIDDPPDQPRRQLLRRPRPTPDDDRGGVADAPLELADHAIGVGQRPAFGRLADDDGPVGGDEQDGRDGGAPRPERDDLWFDPAPPGRAAHRRRRVGRTDVDTELVAHERLLTPCREPLLLKFAPPCDTSEYSVPPLARTRPSTPTGAPDNTL